MADNLKAMPISSLPEKETLEPDDQTIAYDTETGKAYRSNVGALGEAAQGAISDAFSTTKAYSAGDYCIYNDTLYKFTADKDIGAWDDSVVEKTTATAEIQSNTDLIDSLANESRYFGSLDSLLEYVNNAPSNLACTFAVAGDVSSILTNGNQTGTTKGMLQKMGSNYFDFMCFGGGDAYIFKGRYNKGLTYLVRISGTSISLS